MIYKQITSMGELEKYRADLGFAIGDFIDRSKCSADIPAYWQMLYRMFTNDVLKVLTGLFIAVNEDDEFQGFAICWLDTTKYMKFTCEVKAAYIKPGADKNIWNKGWLIIKEWAINKGCESIQMTAIRNPQSYYKKKLFKLGFYPAGIIFKYDLIQKEDKNGVTNG